MFRFRRQTLTSLDYIERLLIHSRGEQRTTQQLVRIIVSNQELFDSYASKIAEQNSQIKAAVAVVISEIAKLQAASESPLDTSKMDAAIEQLTSAVDEVEAIPAPAVEEQPAPVEAVEVEVEAPAVEPDEDEDSEEE